MMNEVDFEQLKDDIKGELARGPLRTFAIVGHTPISYDIMAFFRNIGAAERLLGTYTAEKVADVGSFRPMQSLASDVPDVAIIASDERKEELLEQSVPYLRSTTKVVLAGYAHFAFRNAHFDEVVQESLVPSREWLSKHFSSSLSVSGKCRQTGDLRDRCRVRNVQGWDNDDVISLCRAAREGLEGRGI